MNTDVHGANSSAGTLGLVESSGDRRSAMLRAFEAHVAAGSEMNLDEAFLVISATLKGSGGIEDSLVRLDELAADIASPTVEGIARHLFSGPEAFRGNSTDYFRPENSFLDDVLDLRLGIPITLSVLMIEIGRRLGVPLSGVGMPGHFLVGTHAAVGKIPEKFVDPFHGGTVLDLEGCRQLFSRVTGHPGPFDPRFLAALHPVAILDRALGNLKGVYATRNDTDGLRTVMSLRMRLPAPAKIERDEFLRLMSPFN